MLQQVSGSAASVSIAQASTAMTARLPATLPHSRLGRLKARALILHQGGRLASSFSGPNYAVASGT